MRLESAVSFACRPTRQGHDSNRRVFRRFASCSDSRERLRRSALAIVCTGFSGAGLRRLRGVDPRPIETRAGTLKHDAVRRIDRTACFGQGACLLLDFARSERNRLRLTHRRLCNARCARPESPPRGASCHLPRRRRSRLSLLQHLKAPRALPRGDLLLRTCAIAARVSSRPVRCRKCGFWVCTGEDCRSNRRN